MANLETLELTINANAESASRGLKTLISSLSALSDALAKPYSDLRDFNAALKELKTNSGIKFNISGKIGGITAAKTAAKKAAAEIAENYDIGNQKAVNRGSPDAKPYDQWKREYDAIGEQIKAKQAADAAYYAAAKMKRQIADLPIMKELNKERDYSHLRASIDRMMGIGTQAKSAAESASVFMNKMEDMKPVTDATSKSQMTFGQRIKQAAVNLKDAIPKFNMLHRVLRLASTMLIRMGLKALFKGIKEGLNNYYEYSKRIGNTFSEDMNSVYSTWSKLKNQMGASLAPVLSAALPILNSIASAAVHAFNAISQLFALLSGKNSWSAATDQALDYSNAVGGAGGKTKELLAQFDELNVIASESGGGGGGGAAGDVANMFEEMYEFDEKIRNLVDFIRNNMDSIKGVAIAIGTAILAWKLADAFADTLPLLSKLAALVGVGAVIAITLQATWVLTNQYLNTGDVGWLIADVFTSAVGATAAYAIAQHFIGGNAGAWAASITLAFSALVGIKALLGNTDVSALSTESLATAAVDALKMGAAGAILFTIAGAGIGTALAGGAVVALATFGIVIGLKALLDINKQDGIEWGNISLSQQQVQEFVNDKMFRIDVNASIERINTTIEATAVNKTELRNNLATLIGEMDVIKLGVETTDYTDLKVAVNAVIATVEKYVKDAKAMGKLTLQFTPTLVGQNEGEQGDWFTGYTTGWDIVDNWFKTKGEELGRLLVENEQGVIVSDSTKQQLIQSLTEQLADVTAAISKAEINSAAYAGLASGIGDLTEASAESVFSVFGEYKKNLTEAYTNLVNEQYAKQGELVAALFAIDPNSNAYKEALAAYEEMGKNIPKAIKDGVDSASESGRELIREWLEETFDLNSIGANPLKWTPEYVETMMDYEGLKGILEEAFSDAGFDMNVINISDILEVGGWDYLSEDLRNNINKYLKLTPDDIDMFKSAFDASDMFSIINWNTLSYDMKFEFLDALIDAYGAEEVLAAAKEAGINVDRLLRNGLAAGSEDVKKEAKGIMDKINKEIKKNPPTVPDAKTPSNFFAKVTNLIKEKTTGEKGIFTWLKNRTLVVKDASVPSGFFNKVRDVIKKKITDNATWLRNRTLVVKDASTPSGFFNKAKSAVQTQFSNTKAWLDKQELKVPSIQADSTPSWGAKAAIASVASALQTVANAYSIKIPVGIKPDGSQIKVTISGGGGNSLGTVSMMAMAKGGILDAGTLFLAGEAGPEMVGTINGKTGVANQDQIVDGIRKGVSDAQSEQNGLLREQNNLLRAILAKDNGMKASAALGRIASQSINMYNGLVGG